MLIEDERVCDLVLDRESYISDEIRAKLLIIGIEIKPDGEIVKEWDVEGTSMKISITKMQ